MAPWVIELRQAPVGTDGAARRVALAGAKRLRMPLAETAQALSHAPVVLTRRMSQEQAATLATGLAEDGIEAQAMEAPPGIPPCGVHPMVLTTASCAGCGARACPQCRGPKGWVRCAGCARGARRAKRFRMVRIGLLLLVLAGVGSWAARTIHRRAARADWATPLEVAIILMPDGPVPAATIAALRAGLPRLASRLKAEFVRYRPDSTLNPFVLRTYGPVPVDRAPPKPPPVDTAAGRTRHYLAIRRYTQDVLARGHLTLPSDAIHIYVRVRATDTAQAFVEGFGATNGDLGFVEAQVDRQAIDPALVAIAHELFHCLGASDKYDRRGHAQVPYGLAEPDRRPVYPQRFGALMVGEIPVRPGKGRSIDRLDEIRVGAKTAAEIGWR